EAAGVGGGDGMSVGEKSSRPVLTTPGELSSGPRGGKVDSRPAARENRPHGMSVSEAVRVAFQGLASNKLRSLLTMLGIIIGVGSVIAMMAIGEGANQAARATLQSMGTNVMQLRTG